MSRPPMIVALKMRGATIWLNIAADALPANAAIDESTGTDSDKLDFYMPLLHAIAIDKISRKEEKVLGRYMVTAADFN